MVRSFAPTPLPPEVLDHILRAGLRAPSAGNTQGLDLVVLEGDDTARYWDATLPSSRRADFPWPGLLQAPVLVIPCVTAGAYVARYAEPDKTSTGLGGSSADWPVPYWYVDAGFAAMLMQLAAIDAGLGVLFFGIFGGRDALRSSLRVPATHEPIGTLAIGYPASDDRPSHSARRPRRRVDEVVHRGSW
jgi:nitroreductase